MRALITDRCRIWDINDKETFAEATLKTGRKVKEKDEFDKLRVDNGIAKNGYVPDIHSFVRFVGHAYNKLKDVKEGDLLTNLTATFSKEAYWSTTENCALYPKNEKVTVFDFEIADNEEQTKNTNKNLDKAPQVADEPVKQTVAPVDNTPTETPVDAEDECPF